MSAIMRPRRSLIGLSLIEGSCPELEFGTLNPQDGTPAPSSPVDQLARSSPLAPLRAQRTPARAGSFHDPKLSLTLVVGIGCVYSDADQRIDWILPWPPRDHATRIRLSDLPTGMDRCLREVEVPHVALTVDRPR